MLTIRRLVVHRFRNVVPGTELRFGPGINVLLGKNASGKTTLLELLAAAIGNRDASLLTEPYDITVEFAGHCGSAVVKVDRHAVPAHPDMNGPRYQTSLEIDV